MLNLNLYYAYKSNLTSMLCLKLKKKLRTIELERELERN